MVDCMNSTRQDVARSERAGHITPSHQAHCQGTIRIGVERRFVNLAWGHIITKQISVWMGAAESICTVRYMPDNNNIRIGTWTMVDDGM
jgi:hypothetical protein